MRLVARSDWRDACLHAAASAPFGGLFAAGRGGDDVQLRAVFGDAVVACHLHAGESVDTLVDALPAAGWDEREAHERWAVGFAGHEPLRPLLDHDAPHDAWTVPVHGHGVHEVAVGPTHAGIIESGHFRFHVVGERVILLDVRLGYKHRGLEQAAIGASLSGGLAYAQRACAACTVANGVAYAQACEAALGLLPDDDLRRSRTLLLELERIYNHLHDLSAICAGVGFAAGVMTYAALKERVQRACAQLAGHRFLFGTVAVGAGLLELDGDTARAVRAELSAVAQEHATVWRQLQFAVSVQDRFEGVGVLSAEDAERLGAVGPAARASGVRTDARLSAEGLWYPRFRPAEPAAGATGDVAARTAMRAAELPVSLEIVDALLEAPPGRGAVHEGGRTAAIGVGRVESPRGETVCVVEREGDDVAALHLRTGSYANWPVLAHVVPGELLPDFPLINKSFELCYACADR